MGRCLLVHRSGRTYAGFDWTQVYAGFNMSSKWNVSQTYLSTEFFYIRTLQFLGTCSHEEEFSGCKESAENRHLG